MQYLCDSQASCQIEVGWTKLHFFYQSSQSCHRCFTTKKLCPPTGGMIRYMPMVHDIAVNKVSPWMLARLQTWSAIIFSWVCLSVCLSVCVCLWPAPLPFNVDRFWWNLVTRTLLWSNGPDRPQRDRATPFWKFRKFSKITEFEFQNSGPQLFASVSPVYCKKTGLDSNKTDGGDRFYSLPLWQFRQWHCCSSTTLGGIFWLNQRRGSVQRLKLGGIPNRGVWNWGCNRAVKTSSWQDFSRDRHKID